MNTLSVSNEKKEIERELELMVLLGPTAYISDEAHELRIKLNELRQIEISKIVKAVS